MNTQELNELMKESALDAISYVHGTHGKDITLCQKDLATIDLVLTKLAVEHMQQPISDQDLFTASSILGAFVGELFKTTVGGEWFMDESPSGAPYVVLNYAGKSFAFTSMCFEKIAKTPEVSVARYFELAIGGATQ